ncbi:MAG: polysaccharide biosynthesis C-terminal domain-containing protein [Saprospiraceae bacterium]
MNREFLLNILFLLCINLLIKPFYIFGIERTVQNEVPPGDYGLYFALFNLTLTLQILGDLGIQNFNNRHISQHSHLLSKYFPSMLLLKSILAILYFIIVGIIAGLSGYTWMIVPLLLPIALNQMLNSLLLYFRSNIAGLAMYRADSLISVLDKLFLIIICLIILQISDQFKIHWFVYAQTASMSLTVIIAFFTFYSKLINIRFRINRALLWMILKQSFPYALSVMLMGTYARLDGFLVERLLPDGRLEADVYASAYRLLDASNMIGFLFAGLLLPMFARMLKERQPVQHLLQLSLQLILVGAITLATATFIYRHEIMLALYDKATSYSGEVLGVLIISFIPFCIIYIYGPLLTANQNLQQLNRIFAIAVALNLGLNFIFIPIYKSLGSAAIALLTQSFVAIGQVWEVRRRLMISIPISLILRLCIYTFILMAFADFIHGILNFNWLIGYIIVIISGLLVGMLLGLIYKNTLLEFLQSKNLN